MALSEGQSLAPIFALSLTIALVLVLLVLLVVTYGYLRSRLRATVGDAQDLADLAALRDRYAAEIAQARSWLSDNKEELLKLDAEREAQERLRQELNQQELATAEAQKNVEDSRKEVLDLQHAVTSLADDRQRLQAENEKLAAQASELQREVQRLEQVRSSAEGLSIEATDRVRSLTMAAENLEQVRAELSEGVRQAEARKAGLDSEIRILEVRQQGIQAEVSRLESGLLEAQARLSRVQAELEPIEAQIRERVRLETETRVLAVHKEELEAELSALVARTEELRKRDHRAVAAGHYSDLLDVEPPCLADRVFASGPLRTISEEDALENVHRHLSAHGLVFPQRVIRAFHTCLKVSDISPITVLAGISGTGKSELPMRYAEAMGMHALPISVQPSWSSPQDLFGFYNYLETRFKATELARALVRMDPYNFGGENPAFASMRKGTRSDRMLLVLLDEMNLARVEYYFSEFLSKLEARRAVGDAAQRKMRAPAEIEIDGGGATTNGNEQASDGIRLWVGRNVLFVGTMNEDESTQTLSDKVLDRANVLRFGKPPSDSANRGGGPRGHQFRSDKFLEAAHWASWIRPSQSETRWRRQIDEWTERLNEALGLIGRPFGWRVKEAIHGYIANYPGVEGGAVYRTAMADQIEQKILPKLRGIDITQQQSIQALNLVEAVLSDLGDEELLEAVRDCQRDASYGTFNWRGVTRG